MTITQLRGKSFIRMIRYQLVSGHQFRKLYKMFTQHSLWTYSATAYEIKCIIFQSMPAHSDPSGLLQSSFLLNIMVSLGKGGQGCFTACPKYYPAYKIIRLISPQFCQGNLFWLHWVVLLCAQASHSQSIPSVKECPLSTHPDTRARGGLFLTGTQSHHLSTPSPLSKPPSKFKRKWAVSHLLYHMQPGVTTRLTFL